MEGNIHKFYTQSLKIMKYGMKRNKNKKQNQTIPRDGEHTGLTKCIRSGIVTVCQSTGLWTPLRNVVLKGKDFSNFISLC